MAGLTKEQKAARAAEAAQPQADTAEPQAVALVSMKRDPAMYPAPHSADVHPDEVQNFTAAGFVAA